jgi:hypothetical protein
MASIVLQNNASFSSLSKAKQRGSKPERIFINKIFFICYILVQDGICLYDFNIWTGKDRYNKNAVRRKSGQVVGNRRRTLFTQSWLAVLG